jgi:hypothetical protein
MHTAACTITASYVLTPDRMLLSRSDVGDVGLDASIEFFKRLRLNPKCDSIQDSCWIRGFSHASKIAWEHLWYGSRGIVPSFCVRMRSGHSSGDRRSCGELLSASSERTNILSEAYPLRKLLAAVRQASAKDHIERVILRNSYNHRISMNTSPRSSYKPISMSPSETETIEQFHAPAISDIHLWLPKLSVSCTLLAAQGANPRHHTHFVVSSFRSTNMLTPCLASCRASISPAGTPCSDKHWDLRGDSLVTVVSLRHVIVGCM